MIATEKIRILHIINGLSTGGAEMMLFKLLQHTNRDTFAPSVVSLIDRGIIGEQIQKLDIPVSVLNFSRNKPPHRKIIQLIDLIRIIRPDIVQTWLYHADLIGTIAAFLINKRRVVWNIRHSDLNDSVDKLSTRLIMRVCALLSHVGPDRIICNSFRGARIHKKMGYCQEKFEIIGNGFETRKYRPNKETYLRLRRELNLTPDCMVVGMVARFHPQKNHIGFLESAKRIQESLPDVHFVFCGKGVSKENQILVDQTRRLKLTNVHFLGLRHDIEALTAGFDIAVSNSIAGEGFPNVIGEAMSCGVPCVATDVGDSGYLIGGTGIIVAPDDPQAMAEACIDLLKRDSGFRKRLGEKSRSRIIQHFSIQSIAEKYEELYFNVLSRHGYAFSR